jgi:hypothetical protein
MEGFCPVGIAALLIESLAFYLPELRFTNWCRALREDKILVHQKLNIVHLPHFAFLAIAVRGLTLLYDARERQILTFGVVSTELVHVLIALGVIQAECCLYGPVQETATVAHYAGLTRHGDSFLQNRTYGRC